MKEKENEMDISYNLSKAQDLDDFDKDCGFARTV